MPRRLQRRWNGFVLQPGHGSHLGVLEPSGVLPVSPDPSNPPNPPSIETQLAVIRLQMEQLIELNKTRGEDHESRLRKLEERRFPLQVMAVLISAVALIAAVTGTLLAR